MDKADYEMALSVLNTLETEQNTPHIMIGISFAKEAVKKQTPQKPLNSCGRWGGKSKGGNCPVCGSHTTESVSNFCRKCGQALDWSD
jgi:hypothetical protein